MPKRAKKKVELDAAAETPAILHEPDEPELKAASRASLKQQAETVLQGAKPPEPAEAVAEAAAEAADTFEQAYDDPGRRPEHSLAQPGDVDLPVPAAPDDEPRRDRPSPPAGEDAEPVERPPARLDRLQKILSQAGIASRRHAEEMITQGRVQVNGKVVTELGSKADPDHDHIRVDGKLLHGAERLRYFVLNKPRGYVTTVSDPEGRPTVMHFFQKMRERLYPVGRLDYLSEGLLLVTNDGDLANKLTRAASNVEKTYLVKVSGRPSPEALDQMRSGLAIDRTRPGEGRVQTAPAGIREVRPSARSAPAENPWFEVVLIEGRNRELRKMFEEVGHHVEKIRRVGYGPLVLDVEPGQIRELEPEEVGRLRLASEGKWRKPKPKETERPRQEARPRRETPPRSEELHRPEKPHRPEERRRGREERPRQEQWRDRGAATRGRDTGRTRPPQRDRDWRGGERSQLDGRPPVENRRTSGRSAPSARPASRDQGWTKRREDRGFAPRAGETRPPGSRPQGSRPRGPNPRGSNPRSSNLDGQFTPRPDRQRPPQRPGGRARFDRQGDTGPGRRPSTPRPETRDSAGEYSGKRFSGGQRRPPARGDSRPRGGANRPPARGESRPPSARPANRRPPGQRRTDRPRGPRGRS